MRRVLLTWLLLLATTVVAQGSIENCPASQPVDDLIATVHKLHSKRKNRTKSPAPDSACILGWCLHGKGESKSPQDISIEPPAAGQNADAKTRAERMNCQFATNDALHAAHNVEVGDQYFDSKNYRAAFDRYGEALQQKPSDAAIHVRYARAAEKLGELTAAKEHYNTALTLNGPQKWTDEASSALQRLH